MKVMMVKLPEMGGGIRPSSFPILIFALMLFIEQSRHTISPPDGIV